MPAALCLDSETELILPGRQAPKLVCVSWADGDDVGLEHHTDAKPVVEAALDSDLILTAHNAAYDFAVFAAEWPDLMPKIFDVYNADRITCTRIRERLNHIALGVLGKFERVDGGFVFLEYSLEACARRHLGITLEKDEWRLRYGELMEVPVAFWPEGAREYAKNDALAGYGVWARQEEDPRYLEDQYRQSRAQFWLYLMRAWGVHTDPESVREFARRIQKEYDAIAQDLIAFGLMRMDRKTGRPGARNIKKVQERVAYVYSSQGREVEMTGGGKKGIPQVITDADVCERSGDPILKKYADLSSLKKTLSSDVPLLLEGLTTPIHPGYEVLVQSGRTACRADEQGRGGNLQNLPTEIKWKKDADGKPVFDSRGRCIITDGGMRECFVPRVGKLFAIGDYAAFELRTWAQVCLRVLGQSRMAEVLNTPDADPHCEIACRILKIPYEEAYADYKQNPSGRIYLPRQTGKVCFHPDTEVLTRKGWKKITMLAMSDEVCSAKLSDNGDVDLEWEQPLALTSRYYSGNLVHLKNEGIDLRVTPDHRMCGWKRTVHRNGQIKDSVTTCLPEELGKLRYWANGGYAPGSIEVDERLLRLAVAVQADGSFTSSRAIRLGFTKKRKIDRLKSLLKEDEYRFAVIGSLKVSTFYLTHEICSAIRGLLTEKKTFPWWWIELKPELRAVALDEARFWDSCTVKRMTGYKYSSMHEENVDVLQALASLTLGKSRKSLYVREKEEHSDSHQLTVKTRNRTRGGNLEVVHVPYEGDVYCLTTRNDTILVRDGGVPVITRQCNFGKPGGLGAERLIDYARKSYGVIITLEEAYELSNFWKESWPESGPWFDWVDAQTSVAVPLIKQLFSNRYRGNVSFTEAGNSLFQGLAADAMKAAGFLIARACYAEEDSVLYGARPVLTVHDEFVVEVPDDEHAADAAEELARLMVVGASPFLPDVPPVVEPLLARRWSKAAKPVRDAAGRLIPWDLPRAT